MRLTTDYMGLELKNPLIVSASPFSNHPDVCEELQSHGVSAIVMHSLFEEQINAELHEVDHMLFHGKDSFSEALDFFPENEFENYEIDLYIERLHTLKKRLEIPVIASLNGVSRGGWLGYAKTLQDEGADALELNIYFPAVDPDVDAATIEKEYLDVIGSVRKEISIPMAVKIAPYFTALPNFVKNAGREGAQSVTLFNRLYQPDIDLEKLEWVSRLYKSSSYDFSRTLRAVAMLYDEKGPQLCASGGIRSGLDIIKAVMAGATATAVATVLYEKGVAHAATMLQEAIQWMEENEYESFDQMRGSISYRRSPNPAALERANYVELLHHNDWRIL
jgi:dihydroorotate dehydrogenase (fumarate)